MTSHDNTSGSGLTIPDRSEDQARIERALKVATVGLSFSEHVNDTADALNIACNALREIIELLDGGK